MSQNSPEVEPSSPPLPSFEFVKDTPLDVRDKFLALQDDLYTELALTPPLSLARSALEQEVTGENGHYVRYDDATEDHIATVKEIRAINRQRNSASGKQEANLLIDLRQLRFAKYAARVAFVATYDQQSSDAEL